jgi:hypothetical protein
MAETPPAVETKPIAYSVEDMFLLYKLLKGN